MRTLTSAAPGVPGAASPDRTTRLLLLCGALAGPLFVVAFLLQGAVRDHYDALRHPVSSLELGPYGWVQAVNFVVAGLLTIAFAAGLRRALGGGRGSLWGPVLVGVWGLSLVAAGVFTTDPVSGYPPGTPDLPQQFSGPAAALHDLLSLMGFAAVFATCVVFAVRFAGTRELGWAGYAAATAAVFAVAAVLAITAFDQDPGLVAYGGLFQRTMVTAGWAFLTLLAVRLLRGGGVRSRPDRSAAGRR